MVLFEKKEFVVFFAAKFHLNDIFIALVYLHYSFIVNTILGSFWPQKNTLLALTLP